MKRLTTVFAILVMAIVALADAGVGQLPSGGSAGIMGDDLGIRLVEETVVVELEKDSDRFNFDVRAEFSLHNEGTAKSIFLFLPVSSIDYHSPEIYAIVDGNNPANALDEYNVWLELNGAKLDHQLFIVRKLYDWDDYFAPEDHIPFRTNDGLDFVLWPISRATDEDLDISPSYGWEIWAVCSADIPAGDSTLRYHYEGVPSGSIMSSFSDVYYPLWSGASWSGTIGAGTVTYVYGDGFSVDETLGYSVPQGVEIETLSNGYRFSFENYEPQPDDVVSIEVIVKNELNYLTMEGLHIVPDSDAAFVNGVGSPGDYDHLVILDAQGKWLKLRAECQGKEVVGWAYGKNLPLRDEEIGGELEMVWSNPINFRTEPNSSSERVAGCPTLKPGVFLYFIEREGDWLRIVYDHQARGVSYHHGWARWRYVDPESGEELIYIKSLW